MRTCLVYVSAILLVLSGVSCQKKEAPGNKPLVKVGAKTFTQNDYNAFSSMARIYPIEMSTIFPGPRKQITFMVETEILYNKAPGKIKNAMKKSGDWKWKSRYFPAQIYMQDVIVGNLGADTKEITKYYEARKDSFKVTIKVKPDSGSADTTSRDSTYYRTVDEVKHRLVEDLFYEKYPADSAFIAQNFKKDSADTTPVDPAMLKRAWINNVRNKDRDFLLREAYKKAYRTALPDSLSEWYGDGKAITPADMEVIKGWLNERRRQYYNNPQGEKELAMWLLRWKLFADMAKKSGHSQRKDNAATLEWAWKYQVVNAYVTDLLIPKAESRVTLDTAACVYSYWDNISRVVIPPDSAGMAGEIALQTERETFAMLDSIIYGYRVKRGVKFMQTDLKDEKDQDPALVIAKADSLRDSGKVDEAEKLYAALTQDYSFTAEGRRAFAEVAKLQTENQKYSLAIRNYRICLVSGRLDKEKLCNYYFMIGFVYDEYMNKAELAEQQYRWILKNTPECELADDAEFMALHLDEPMIRIEDLRAEALRQGRNIDYSAEDTLLTDE